MSLDSVRDLVSGAVDDSMDFGVTQNCHRIRIVLVYKENRYPGNKMMQERLKDVASLITMRLREQGMTAKPDPEHMTGDNGIILYVYR